MENDYVYMQIADSIRADISSGKFVSGDKLPTVRELTRTWNCTVGTAQRAYQKLASEGLVITRVGKGTLVIGSNPVGFTDPLRRAALIHRAEGFLLEVLTNGYSPLDVEDAVRTALDRWRVVSALKPESKDKNIRFSGSHDLAVAWMATHFNEIVPGVHLQIAFSGSLGGILAIANNEADVAGAHLWDDKTDSYNVPFIQKHIPGVNIALITLAHRRIGLIVQSGNPKSINNLRDLTKPGVKFVNRQPGSGTRVWLDAMLKKEGIMPVSINGYYQEKSTHSDVAAEVANHNVDVGIGLEAAARAYGLDFIFLTRERYDMIMRYEEFETGETTLLLKWLKGKESKSLFDRLKGYESDESGEVRWIR
jgi:molybdate-binding protein/DNA-binding transcriptional regulator YhcF (GntR family)